MQKDLWAIYLVGKQVMKVHLHHHHHTSSSKLLRGSGSITIITKSHHISF